MTHTYDKIFFLCIKNSEKNNTQYKRRLKTIKNTAKLAFYQETNWKIVWTCRGLEMAQKLKILFSPYPPYKNYLSTLKKSLVICYMYLLFCICIVKIFFMSCFYYYSFCSRAKFWHIKYTLMLISIYLFYSSSYQIHIE